jgi:hypothetical protein
VVNGEAVQPERRSVVVIASLIANYRAAIGSLIANYRAAHSPRAKTKRATMDYVRVDVDAFFDEDSLRGATGAIIRESKGQFVAASNTKVEHVVDALSAKHKL